MKAFLLIFLLISFFCRGYSQYVRINETTFILVDEDKATQEKTASLSGQKIEVLFLGFFEKDFVKLVYNKRCVFADTISTIDTSGEQIPQKVGKKWTLRKRNKFTLKVNDLKTRVPLRKGYKLLYISFYPDNIDNRQVYIYSFTYTNKYLAGM